MKIQMHLALLSLAVAPAAAGTVRAMPKRNLEGESPDPPAIDDEIASTRTTRTLKRAPLRTGSNPTVTFQPGCFDHGDHIYE